MMTTPKIGDDDDDSNIMLMPDFGEKSGNPYVSTNKQVADGSSCFRLPKPSVLSACSVQIRTYYMWAIDDPQPLNPCVSAKHALHSTLWNTPHEQE